MRADARALLAADRARRRAAAPHRRRPRDPACRHRRAGRGLPARSSPPPTRRDAQPPRDEEELHEFVLALGQWPGSGRSALGSALFAALSREELRRVAGGLHPRCYSPGDLIVREGDPGASIFLIASGSVRILVTGGREQPFEIRRIDAGDFFGEVAALAGRPRTATVVAATPCEALEIDRGGPRHPGGPASRRARPSWTRPASTRVLSPEESAVRALPPEAADPERAAAALRAHFGGSRLEPARAAAPRAAHAGRGPGATTPSPSSPGWPRTSPDAGRRRRRSRSSRRWSASSAGGFTRSCLAPLKGPAPARRSPRPGGSVGPSRPPARASRRPPSGSGWARAAGDRGPSRSLARPGRGSSRRRQRGPGRPPRRAARRGGGPWTSAPRRWRRAPPRARRLAPPPRPVPRPPGSRGRSAPPPASSRLARRGRGRSPRRRAAAIVASGRYTPIAKARPETPQRMAPRASPPPVSTRPQGRSPARTPSMTVFISVAWGAGSSCEPKV